jgi:hypothetical protein
MDTVSNSIHRPFCELIKECRRFLGRSNDPTVEMAAAAASESESESGLPDVTDCPKVAAAAGKEVIDVDAVVDSEDNVQKRPPGVPYSYSATVVPAARPTVTRYRDGYETRAASLLLAEASREREKPLTRAQRNRGAYQTRASELRLAEIGRISDSQSSARVVPAKKTLTRSQQRHRAQADHQTRRIPLLAEPSRNSMPRHPRMLHSGLSQSRRSASERRRPCPAETEAPVDVDADETTPASTSRRISQEHHIVTPSFESESIQDSSAAVEQGEEATTTTMNDNDTGLTPLQVAYRINRLTDATAFHSRGDVKNAQQQQQQLRLMELFPAEDNPVVEDNWPSLPVRRMQVATGLEPVNRKNAPATRIDVSPSPRLKRKFRSQLEGELPPASIPVDTPPCPRKLSKRISFRSQMAEVLPPARIDAAPIPRDIRKRAPGSLQPADVLPPQTFLSAEDRRWLIKAGAATNMYRVRQFDRLGAPSSKLALKMGRIASWARILPSKVKTIEKAKQYGQKDAATLQRIIHDDKPGWFQKEQSRVTEFITSETRFMNMKAGDVVALVVPKEKPRRVYFGLILEDDLDLCTKEECQGSGFPSPKLLERDLDCRLMIRRVHWWRKGLEKNLRRQYASSDNGAHASTSWLKQSKNSKLEVEDVQNNGGELFSSEAFLRATETVTAAELEGM